MAITACAATITDVGTATIVAATSIGVGTAIAATTVITATLMVTTVMGGLATHRNRSARAAGLDRPGRSSRGASHPSRAPRRWSHAGRVASPGGCVSPSGPLACGVPDPETPT